MLTYIARLTVRLWGGGEFLIVAIDKFCSRGTDFPYKTKKNGKVPAGVLYGVYTYIQFHSECSVAEGNYISKHMSTSAFQGSRIYKFWHSAPLFLTQANDLLQHMSHQHRIFVQSYILQKIPLAKTAWAVCSHSGWLLLKWSAVCQGLNHSETNCRIAHVLGILLMISYWFAFYFSDIIVVFTVSIYRSISISAFEETNKPNAKMNVSRKVRHLRSVIDRSEPLLSALHCTLELYKTRKLNSHSRY